MKTPIAYSFLLSALFLGLTCSVRAQWTDVGPGTVVNPDAPRNVFCLSPIGENGLWASPIHPTFQDVREVMRTLDGGNTWDIFQLPETDGNYLPVRILAENADEARVVALRYPSPGRTKLFYTTDGGGTWTDIPGPYNEQGKGVQNIHFFTPQEGVMFGSPRTGDASVDKIKIFRTSDGGQSWVELFDPNVPEPASNDSYFLLSGNDSYAAVGDTLWFVTTENNVYRTTSRGANWQVFSTGLQGSSTIAGLTSVAFKDALNGMVVTFQPQQVAVTQNGGSSWTEVAVPESPTARCVQYVPGTDNTYVITDGYEGNSDEIAITFDGGQTWESWPGNPAMNCVSFQSTTSGWGGSNINTNAGGIYRWDADLETVLSVSEVEPLNASIFPNPARNTINIRFGDTKSLEANVEIYSVTGKRHLSVITQPGSDAQLDIAELPVGMYVVAITSGGARFHGKFVKAD